MHYGHGMPRPYVSLIRCYAQSFYGTGITRQILDFQIYVCHIHCALLTICPSILSLREGISFQGGHTSFTECSSLFFSPGRRKWTRRFAYKDVIYSNLPLSTPLTKSGLLSYHPSTSRRQQQLKPYSFRYPLCL